MMDSKLETLITLLELKNYTKAASKLYITQPAVTHHIKAIEKEYDVTLFVNNKTFELTRQGEIILEYAKTCKAQENLLKNILNKQTNVNASIGITNLAVQCVRKRIISNLNKGKISFDLFSYPYQDIKKMLSSGELDFAIIDNTFDSTIYESLFLFTERIILVCDPNGQYKNVNKLTREQLSSSTIVMPDKDCGLYSSVNATIKLKNIRLRNTLIITANNLDLIRALIRQNDGVAFVYEDSVSGLIEAGKLKRLELANFAPSQNFYLLYNKLSRSDNKVKTFLNLLEESGVNI